MKKKMYSLASLTLISALAAVCLQSTQAHATSDLDSALAKLSTGSTLTSAEESAVAQEGSGETILAETPDDPRVFTASFSGCWSKGLEAQKIGGITKTRLFTASQTTQVCVENGKVTSVAVVSHRQKVHGINNVAWREAGITPFTMNVGWEGRGVVQARFDYAIKGNPLGSQLLCPQLRLNADGHSLLSKFNCELA